MTRLCRQIGVHTQVVRSPAIWSTSLRFTNDRRIPNPAALAWNACALALAGLSVQRRLKKLSPQLVVTRGMSAHFYGGLAARLSKLPCVWHLQDYISDRYLGAYRRLFAMLAARIPNRVVADGSPIKRQLPPAVQARTSVVYNGVDTAIFQPGQDGQRIRREFGIPPDALVIGSVSRLTPWKGQHHLVEAFARIAADLPEAILLIVGGRLRDSGAYEKRLRSMAEHSGLGRRVVFAGHRADLPQILAAMDVYVHTATEKDTSPLALISAMACGLPVVAFAIEGVQEILQDGSDALLAPRADTASLATLLLKVCRDPQLRIHLGRGARQKVEGSLSLKRHCDLMMSLFAEVCGAARAPSNDGTVICNK